MIKHEMKGYYKKRTLNLINGIENRTKQMFHVQFPKLAQEHSDLMERSTPSQWMFFNNTLCKLIDNINKEGI